MSKEIKKRDGFFKLFHKYNTYSTTINQKKGQQHEKSLLLLGPHVRVGL